MNEYKTRDPALSKFRIMAETIPQHPMSQDGLSNLDDSNRSEKLNSDPDFDTLGKDDAVLASLGYKAELKREFRALEVFGLMFSIFGLLPSIASTLVFSMPAGGPVGMVISIISRFISGLGMDHCRLSPPASRFGNC